jgi:poly(3-hydroxyalkanoate) synthetase
MDHSFELWRLAWSNVVARALHLFAEPFPGGGVSAAAPPAMPVFRRVRLELATMRLLEERRPAGPLPAQTVIVAPFAVHDASIADFAEGHSLARTLREAGAGPLALTWWKSAAAHMSAYGLDAYFSDLNVAVDDLGGRVSLVGLCQGGWLAAAYAARFPAKVSKLVMAGAPIDLSAAESTITRALAAAPREMIEGLVAVGGGRVSGSLSLGLWPDDVSPDFSAEAALQEAGDPMIVEQFNAWNARTLDLPGAYFVQTAEWVFRENRLARGVFPALGRTVALSSITAPVFVLAAADDEVVSLRQAIAVQDLCRQTRVTIRVVPGRHLSLFMGRRTVEGAWAEIGRWLAAKEHRPAPTGKRGRKRQSEAESASGTPSSHPC